MAGWWGSSGPPQPVTYEELPSPRTQDDFERLADSCFTQLLQLEKEGPADGWTAVDFHAENGEEEVKIWDKSMPGTPVACLKTEGVIPCSPKNLYKVLCDEDLAKRQAYEKDLTLYEHVREITPEIAVTRAQYKAPFPVTAREVVALRARRRLSDGGFVSFGKSINYEACLTDSSHVRAAVHLVGALCRPIPGEPNRCMLIRIGQLDPKGNIPTMVVNATKKKSGSSVILLRKVIRKMNLPEESEEESNIVEATLDDGGRGKAAASNDELTAATSAADLSVPIRPQSTRSAAQPGATAVETDRKGKSKESTNEPAKTPEPADVGGSGSVAGDDTIFYEAAASLPWDETPFKRMYGQHRDEINQLVSSLQESINRIEQISTSNEQRLQALEAQLRTQHRASGARGSVLDLTNLSWGALAFLVAWPVVAYAAYDAVTSRLPRPPRGGPPGC